MAGQWHFGTSSRSFKIRTACAYKSHDLNVTVRDTRSELKGWVQGWGKVDLKDVSIVEGWGT